MVLFDIVEKLNPEVFLITFNKEGKRIYGGNRISYIKYAEEELLSAEVREINTTSLGAIIASVDK